MILVPGGDLGLEDKLLKVAWAVPGEGADAFLLD